MTRRARLELSGSGVLATTRLVLADDITETCDRCGRLWPPRWGHGGRIPGGFRLAGEDLYGGQTIRLYCCADCADMDTA